MLSKAKVWVDLEKIIKEENLFLFDIEMPSIQSSTLRIYISKVGGVGLEDCAGISRKISKDPELGKVLEDYNLEVSSPGINRKLTRPEHFSGAIGERLKLILKVPGDNVVIGILKKFDGINLDLSVGEEAELRRVVLSDISKARVDFVFDRIKDVI